MYYSDLSGSFEYLCLKWVYGHYKYLCSYSAGIDVGRQNSDVYRRQVLTTKVDPALKGLRRYVILLHFYLLEVLSRRSEPPLQFFYKKYANMANSTLIAPANFAQIKKADTATNVISTLALEALNFFINQRVIFNSKSL